MKKNVRKMFTSLIHARMQTPVKHEITISGCIQLSHCVMFPFSTNAFPSCLVEENEANHLLIRHLAGGVMHLVIYTRQQQCESALGTEIQTLISSGLHAGTIDLS